MSPNTELVQPPSTVKRKGRAKNGDETGKRNNDTANNTKRDGVPSCGTCTSFNRAGATPFCQMCAWGTIQNHDAQQGTIRLIDKGDDDDNDLASDTVTSSQQESSTVCDDITDDNLLESSTNNDFVRELQVDSMLATTTGKAYRFVEMVVQMGAKFDAEFEKIELPPDQYLRTLSVDDMVELAEKMIELQNTFRSDQKDHVVTIGYHYTDSSNLESIQKGGLMSGLEQRANGVSCGSTRNRNSTTVREGTYGHGIYTATNPFAFQSYGDVGLMVAILKGTVKRVHRKRSSHLRHEEADTVIGNKSEDSSWNDVRQPYNDEIVLRQSAQCLPLICYSKSMLVGQSRVVDSRAGQLVWRYHQELQSLVNRFFNYEVNIEATLTEPLLPPDGGLLLPQTSHCARLTLSPPTRMTEWRGSRSASSKRYGGLGDDWSTCTVQSFPSEAAVCGDNRDDCTGGAVVRCVR